MDLFIGPRSHYKQVKDFHVALYRLLYKVRSAYRYG